MCVTTLILTFYNDSSKVRARSSMNKACNVRLHNTWSRITHAVLSSPRLLRPGFSIWFTLCLLNQMRILDKHKNTPWSHKIHYFIKCLKILFTLNKCHTKLFLSTLWRSHQFKNSKWLQYLIHIQIWTILNNSAQL